MENTFHSSSADSAQVPLSLISVARRRPGTTTLAAAAAGGRDSGRTVPSDHHRDVAAHPKLKRPHHITPKTAGPARLWEL